MRLRNVKGSKETIAASPLVIQNITEKKRTLERNF